jgi:putative membrane protein
MTQGDAASAPTPAGFAGEARRLHPLTLLLAVVKLGPRTLNFLPAILALGVTGQARLIIPALGLFLLVTLVFSSLAWTRFSWTVDSDDIAIASGVLSRTHRTIPFDRIQDVTIEQGIIARALGLAKVGFETGSAAGDENEAKLDSIALAHAEALRAHIRAHRALGAGAAAAAPAEAAQGSVAPAEDRPIYAMTMPRLLLAGLFNFSLAVFAVLFGLLQTFDDVLPFDPFDADFWIEALRSTGLADWVDAHRWLSAVAGVVMLLLLGAATGIVRTVMRDYGFRLDRSERGFRRRRGLTTKTDVAIPIARVQAAIVSTGLIRRRLGWYELRLQSLASDGKNESDHLVAPFARIEEIDAILAEVGLARGEEGEAAPWQRGHPGTIWVAPAAIFLIGTIMLIPNMVASDAFILSDWIEPGAGFVLGVPLLVAATVALLGWLGWKGRCWRFDGRQLHMRRGLFAPTHIILPARNIQSADLALGPVLRRLSAANLHFGVPGGSGGQHVVHAAPVADAHRLRAALLAAT